VDFRIVGTTASIEVIATEEKDPRIDTDSKSLRLRTLAKAEGNRKSHLRRREHRKIHWYEAHGIGKKEFKIKRLLEETREG
jgi:hypothetical protein